MKKTLHLLAANTEYYLILLVLLTSYSPPLNFHPISIVFIAALFVQIKFKNKFIGLGFAALLFLGNLLFLFALISEASEFTIYNSRFRNLLIGGSTIFFIHLNVSILMFYNYYSRNT